MGETVELGDGRWKLVVAPAQGGGLLACERDGVPVLLPAERPAGGLGGKRCYFPLIPFSNRIEQGRFAFGGAAVALGPTVPGSAHALHGHGWQAAWQVIERSRTRCELAFDHAAAPGWPWPYRGRQTIALVGGALRITLGIENLGAAPMPCGLGFHPFLPAEGARLAFEAAQVFDGRAETFPRKRVAVPAALDFRGGPRVSERRGMDHCFDGWTGRAAVSHEAGGPAWLLEGCADTRFLIVYVPDGGDYFCVEPVTHAVNAMNHPDPAESGLWVLDARESRAITLTLKGTGTFKGVCPL